VDNCEHLAGAAATVVADLLAGCPGLSVLATSQRPLGVAGERVWPLAPLSMPGPGRSGAGSDAVALFHTRAKAVFPGFVVDDQGAGAVEEICRRLDGIPLAIELAAARTAVLSPAEIAEHLDERFNVLTRRTPGPTVRHQSLQSALDWSWDLLSTAEQTLLRRLSVFAGGAGLVEVKAVCAGGAAKRAGVVDLLEALVSTSLVVADTAGPRARYRLLETVRAYALDRLQASGEADTVAEQHADAFAAMAEKGWHRVLGGQQGAAEALETEHENLRAALGWLLAHGEVGSALAMGSALTPFWRTRGHFREGREWLKRALAGAPDAPPGLRVRGLWGVGTLSIMQGDLKPAARVLEESLELARAHRIDRATIQALNLLGLIAMFTEKPASAMPLLKESMEMARANEDTDSLITGLAMYGRAHLNAGDLAAARTAFDECLELGRIGDDQIEGFIGLGWVALAGGQHDLATDLLSKALPMVGDGTEPFESALVLSFLGELAWRRGDDADAKARLDEGLHLSRTMGAPFPLARCLLGLGRVAHSAERHKEALDLVGEAVDVARRAQLANVLVRCLLAHAELHRTAGRHAEARERLDEALALAAEQGDKGGTADTLRGLGTLARLSGDYQAASGHLLDALRLHMKVTDMGGVADDLAALAGLALAQDRAQHGARLAAAADTIRRSAGGWASPLDRPGHEADLALLRAALDDDELEEAQAQGAQLSPEEAVALAARSRSGRKRPVTGWAALTPTESQAVDLVADGLTNNEIGERLFVSPRTVQGHLRRAFQKLGVQSRRELREQHRQRS